MRTTKLLFPLICCLALSVFSSAEEAVLPPSIELVGHRAAIYFAAFSPDGKNVVSTSFDYTVRIWDAETGKELHTFYGHTKNVRYAEFSPDGTKVVSVSEDKTARIWDTNSGKELYRIEKEEYKVSSAVFSPDGKVIATVGGTSTTRPMVDGFARIDDGSIRIWDAKSGEELHILKCRTVDTSITFSPDGKRIVASHGRNQQRGVWIVQIWDVESGEIEKVLEGYAQGNAAVNQVIFSPDGKKIATADWRDKTARIWEAETGKILKTLEGGHTDWVTGAAFSPDGKKVVTKGGNIQLWDAESGKKLYAFPGYVRSANSRNVSPDGKKIVIPHGGDSANIWILEK